MDSNKTEVKPPGESAAAALPDHGTKYYKSFWGSYKGHVRGLLRGLLMGAVAGLAVGLGVALLTSFGLFAGIGLAATTSAGALIATFTGIGAVFSMELMAKIGNTAGNAAAYFAQKELLQRYPSLPEISSNSPAPGIGHHFEIPPDGDEKFFHPKVAWPGLLVGTALGALLAVGTHGAGAELLGHTGLELFQGLGGNAAAAATVGAGGLMGASFGINRGKFKTLFNYTDNLLMGKMSGPTSDQIARDQARYKSMDPEHPYVVTGSQLYDEYQRLLTGYYKKSFAAGWSGDRRGFLGGLVAGTISGVAAGGLACMGLVAFGLVTSAAMGPFLLPVIALCAAFGGKQGMNIFADAGRESAAFSVADEIYAERIKSLKTGKDIPFDDAEKRAADRMTLHPDMDPPGTEYKTWFNWKIGVVGLLAGALVGVVFAPIAAAFLPHLLMHGVATLGLTQVLPLSIAVFGLAGATFGMGDKTMDRLNGVADKIFMGTILHGHGHVEDHTSGHHYPPLAPDSPLIEKTTTIAAATAPIIVPTEEKAGPEPELEKTPQAKEASTIANVPPAPSPPRDVISEILTVRPVESAPFKPEAKEPSFILRKMQEVELSGGELALRGP